MAGINTFKIPNQLQFYEDEGMTPVDRKEVIDDATQAKINAFKARKIGANVFSAFSIKL